MLYSFCHSCDGVIFFAFLPLVSSYESNEMLLVFLVFSYSVTLSNFLIDLSNFLPASAYIILSFVTRYFSLSSNIYTNTYWWF